MTINDGGPAFPLQGYKNLANAKHYPPETGMSLRAWYAGMALDRMIDETGGWTKETTEKEGYADWYDAAIGESCKFADAMIAELDKAPDDPRDPDVEYDRATEQGVRHE